MSIGTEVAAATAPRDLAMVIEGRRLLAEAKSLDEAKFLSDQMRMRNEALEAQDHSGEIALRADRRAAKEWKKSPKRKAGRRPKENRSQRGTDLPATAEDQGISKKDMERFAAHLRISDEEFEEYVKNTKRANGRLTKSGILRVDKQLKIKAECETSPLVPLGPRIVGKLREIIDRGEKFSTIYADPPWQYGNQGTRAATDDHYKTMSVAEICAEPVREIAADNAHLHLWTTNAFLFDAKDVMEAWGFTYKSCFIWIKPQMGIGNYWRVSHEFLLLGIRGNAPFGSRNVMSWDAHDEDSHALCPECGQSLAYGERSWGSYDRGRHSAKPDEIRRKIEKVSPGPYLEMYGRVLDPNGPWTVYGNQVVEKEFLPGLEPVVHSQEELFQ